MGKRVNVPVHVHVPVPVHVKDNVNENKKQNGNENVNGGDAGGRILIKARLSIVSVRERRMVNLGISRESDPHGRCFVLAMPMNRRLHKQSLKMPERKRI